MGIEILLRQGFDFWPEMLNGGPAGDKPMVPQAAFRSFQIADTVLQLLFPVLELLQLLLSLLLLLSELFDFGIRIHNSVLLFDEMKRPFCRCWQNGLYVV